MIYCVEDDNGIRELMIYTLCASGFDARGFAESGAFWQALQEEKPQLILCLRAGEDPLRAAQELIRAFSALLPEQTPDPPKE